MTRDGNKNKSYKYNHSMQHLTVPNDNLFSTMYECMYETLILVQGI